jgi:SAM-dependent methyltransferase
MSQHVAGSFLRVAAPSTSPTKLRDRVWLIDSWLPSKVDRLLDAGCARGEATAVYARKASHAVGIELNSEDAADARARYPTLEFIQAACETIPFPESSFDAVVCADVLEHVRDEVRSLAEIRRVLEPTGLLILTTPHRGWFDRLDPVNYPRQIAPALWRLSPRIYRTLERRTQDLAPEGRPGAARAAEHRHYRVEEIERLLEQAGWELDGAVERVFRGGGLPYALWQNVGYFSSLALRPFPRLHRLVLSCGGEIGHLDYRIRWGRAAFNLALCVRRL